MPNREKSYWPDDTIYFLTGSTFAHYPYFKEDEQKEIILNQIRRIEEKLKILIPVYSISINHYHIKFFLKNGLELAKIKQFMHGGTTYEYRKKFKMKYKEMWQSSKVLQIASDEMDWKVTGYIAGNLLKHKEVSTLNDLKQNPFSCYKKLIEQYDKNFINSLIYSVIGINEDSEGEINIGKLKEAKASIPTPSAKAG